MSARQDIAVRPSHRPADDSRCNIQSTVPVLQSLLLDAAGDTLTITGTDLDDHAHESLVATVAIEGQIAVPAQAMLKMLRLFDPGTELLVELAPDSNPTKIRLILTAGDTTLRLNTLPAADYPHEPDRGVQVREFARLKTDAASFAQSIRKMLPSVSSEETRYYLKGVYVHRTTDGLRMVATDGHRMSILEYPTAGIQGNWPAHKESAPIIPGNTLERLLKVLPSKLGTAIDIILTTSPKGDPFILFRWGSTVLSSKTIVGTFPDYPSVAPAIESLPGRIEVERQALAQAVKRLTGTMTGRSRAGNMKLNGSLIISTTDFENGEAEIRLPVTAASPEPVETTFNLSHLASAIATLDGPTVRLRVKEYGWPAIIDSPSHPALQILLMPMR